MKKLIGMILVLTLVLTLCACGTSAEESTQTTDASALAEDKTPEGPPTSGTVAVLSQLNLTEDEYSALLNGK